MKVPELFNIYKELRSSIKYCPYRNGIDSIFVDYKEKFNGFQNSEIETLEVYLSHNEDRWFVFYLLSGVNEQVRALARFASKQFADKTARAALLNFDDTASTLAAESL